MPTYTIERTGRRPLRFTADMLHTEDGAWHQGKEQNRYHTITLYRLEAGDIVVHWHYRTQWQGESDSHEAIAYQSLDEALSAIEAYDPVLHVMGYKPLIQAGHDHEGRYASMQAAVDLSIMERYYAQVSAIAHALDVVEEL